MNRGNQRWNVFRDDADRRRFLMALREACAKTGWQSRACRLLRTYFHLDEQIRRDWCLGDKEFWQELLARRQPARGRALWLGAPGAGRGQRPPFGGGTSGGAGLEGGRFGLASQRRCAQGYLGGAVAPGNHDELEMDRERTAHGQLDLCLQSAGRKEQRCK